MRRRHVLVATVLAGMALAAWIGYRIGRVDDHARSEMPSPRGDQERRGSAKWERPWRRTSVDAAARAQPRGPLTRVMPASGEAAFDQLMRGQPQQAWNARNALETELMYRWREARCQASSADARLELRFEVSVEPVALRAEYVGIVDVLDGSAFDDAVASCLDDLLRDGIDVAASPERPFPVHYQGPLAVSLRVTGDAGDM